MNWRRRLAVCLQKANSSIIQNKVSAIVEESVNNSNPAFTISARYFASDFT